MKLFAPRWKRYAPWPVVIWCRIADHMQRYPGFCAGGYYRCARCGDALEPLNHKVGVGYDGGTS